MNKSMQRHNIYEINEVLSLVNLHKDKKDPVILDIPDIRVKFKSDRYKVFSREQTCVRCGLEATHFALERHLCNAPDGPWHFNLYALVTDYEILFTKDHIKPKSKAGPNRLDNYQTMCYLCNQEKSNK